MIHRITIQNFKSIRKVTVDLEPVTVLVGQSGTGKSNFIQGLQFLRDALCGRIQNLQQELTRLPPVTDAGSTLGLDVEFSIQGITDRFRYGIELSLPQIKREYLFLGEKCLFHQQQVAPNRTEIEWVVPPDVVQPPSTGQIVIGRISSIPEIVSAFVALTDGIGCYIFTDTVLCKHQSDPGSRGLSDSGGNYVDVLKDIVGNLQDLKIRSMMVETLKQLNDSVTSVELNDFRNPSHVVVGHRHKGKIASLQLVQESDGFRRFYAYLLALYQRPPKQTLLFEHPEDGIHPGAVSLLADEFKAAPGDGRGQVILTTHSPLLLDQFEIEQVRVVDRVGFETQIGPVSSEQRIAIHEKLLHPGELLTVDPARLEAAVL